MDKEMLRQYTDSCELLYETIGDIEKLEKRKGRVVSDSVHGSMQEFPYAEKTFHIEGLEDGGMAAVELEREKRLLEERMQQTRQLKEQVQRELNYAPIRIQRIIRYRYMEKISWEQTAIRMQEGKSGDSYRMELQRYLKKTENNEI
jgi:hypothetical protein